MNGGGHAAVGAALATLTLPLTGPVGAAPLLWYGAWIGGSLLPDTDLNGSNAARVWGAPTRIACTVVSAIAGGHRGQTHRPIAAPAVTAAVLTVALLWPPTAILVLAYIIGIALRITARFTHWRMRRPIPNAVVAFGLAALVVNEHFTIWWAPLVIAAAIAAHILADQ